MATQASLLLQAELSKLRAEYPGGEFALTRGHDGPRIYAVPPKSPGGLYSLTTASPAEVRIAFQEAGVPRSRQNTAGLTGDAR